MSLHCLLIDSLSVVDNMMGVSTLPTGDQKISMVMKYNLYTYVMPIFFIVFRSV